MNKTGRIEIRDAEVLAKLREIARRGEDLKPLLKGIGADLVASTQLRFRDATDPSGRPWQPLSHATMVLRLMRNKRNFRRNGRGAKFRGQMRYGLASLSAAGRREAAAGFAPLRDTGTLANSITFKVEGKGTLVVGTNWGRGSIKGGAAIHQFGGMAGRGRKVRIPARPFLGINEGDRNDMLARIAEFMAGTAP